MGRDPYLKNYKDLVENLKKEEGQMIFTTMRCDTDAVTHWRQLKAYVYLKYFPTQKAIATTADIAAEKKLQPEPHLISTHATD
jgi:hypothetical protein